MPHPLRLMPLTGSSKYRMKFTSTKALYPYQSFNICLITPSGDALLRRITNTTNDLETIFEFQGPPIKSINSIMLAAEDSTWELKDVYIHLVDSDQEYTFTTPKSKIGGEEASYMLPRPLLKDMKPIYDAEYTNLKDTILVTTIELLIIGTVLMTFVFNAGYGSSFAMGGSLGLLYVKLLQDNIDIIGTKGSSGHSIVRLGVLTVLIASLLDKYHQNIQADHTLFIGGMLGFFVYRVSIIYAFKINATNDHHTENRKEN